MGESPSTREGFYYVGDAQVAPVCLENCPVGLTNCSGMKLKVIGKRQSQTDTSIGATEPRPPQDSCSSLQGVGEPWNQRVGICLLLQLCTFISPDKYSSNLYIKIFHNLPADSDLNPVMQMKPSHFSLIHNGFGNKAICVNQLFLWINISNPFFPPRSSLSNWSASPPAL